jgi:hypothetical protein
MTLPPAPSGWTIDLANAERLEAVAAFPAVKKFGDILETAVAVEGKVNG